MSKTSSTTKTTVFYYKSVGGFEQGKKGSLACCTVSLRPIEEGGIAHADTVTVYFALDEVLMNRPEGSSKRGQLWKRSLFNRSHVRQYFFLSDLELSIEYSEPLSDGKVCKSVVIDKVVAPVSDTIRSTVTMFNRALRGEEPGVVM